ncbi:DUF4232 domain-containing protein [Streptomyces sp. NBC_01304]|uniref:DUF4232 domain-containing protein n=1 Tax=Streptomyces sp. NBC_01304 TaxID=2903818 RepID=UPI002E122502|nr:DUF4232 domain-containing protein [Streptomyces sp. NBC_01304]
MPSPRARPSATNSSKPGAGSGDTDGDEGGDKDVIAGCTADALAVSAQKEPADAKDARHLLVTVQNTGDKKCHLYHYPVVQLGADALRFSSGSLRLTPAAAARRNPGDRLQTGR